MRFLVKIFNFLLGVFVLIAVGGLAYFSILVAYEQKIETFPKPPIQYVNTPPPDYILVNGERWVLYRITGLTRTTGNYGETDCISREITYDSNIPVTALRETVWHETMHAELCYKLLQKGANWEKHIDGEEHDVIYPLSMAQISFMHDNPEFMKWMGNW